MKIKKPDYKKVNGRLLCLFIALVFLSLTVLQSFPLQLKPVYAANAGNFAMFVGGAGAQQKAVADAWNAGGGDDYDHSGWQAMNIPVKDFAGLGKTILAFDGKFTKEIACSGDAIIADSCESREPVFTKRYYCTVSNKKLSFTKPAGDTTEYYEIVYAIGLKDNGNSGDAFVKRDTFKATGGPILVKKFETNGSSFAREVVTRDLTSESNGPQHFDDKRKDGKNGRGDDDWGIDGPDAGCRPPGSLTGTMNIKNYSKLSAAEKKDFQDPAEAAGDGKEPPDSNPDCSTTLTNPLSWIICPIIDLGANFTDAVFTTFVRPLLEDIPIGNDPSDGGYRAWQSFRALGNIVLVGCLLAIVYAQARGDK